MYGYEKFGARYVAGDNTECPHCYGRCREAFVLFNDDGSIGCDHCVTVKKAGDEPFVCAVCGCECDELYYDADGVQAGCDECVLKMDPYEAGFVAGEHEPDYEPYDY